MAHLFTSRNIIPLLVGALMGLEPQAQGPTLFRADEEGLSAFEAGIAVDGRLVAVDLDGNGALDLLIINSLSPRVVWNDGSGLFSQFTILGNYTNYRNGAVGDLDGDGDSDIVLGGSAQGLKLLVNDGKGRFTEGPSPAMTTSNDLLLADVDGDLDLDLIVAHPTQNLLLLNDGKGGFTDATWGRMPLLAVATLVLAAGDVDGDGDLDLVLGLIGQNRLLLNDGSGTFSDVTNLRLPQIADSTAALLFGDVDRDGDLDLLVGNLGTKPFEQNRCLLNDGKGTFTDATAKMLPAYLNPTRSLALGDIDGDGDPDLVSGEGEGWQDLLFLNDGKGVFTDATWGGRMPQRNNNTSSVVLADLDGDGALELAATSILYYPPLARNLGNYILRNDGKGWFTDYRTFFRQPSFFPALDDSTGALLLIDLDKDGDLDLYVGNDYSQQDRFYLNDGHGRFTEATATVLPVDTQNTLDIAPGDFDGDGDIDLFLGIWGQSQVYLNDGKGRLYQAAQANLPQISLNTTSVAVGDLDGDGDLDVVLGNHGSNTAGQNRIYLNDGKGVFTDATLTHFIQRNDITYDLVLFDADRDGDLDLMVGNEGQNYLYFNDGSGRFAPAPAGSIPTRWDATRDLAVADFSGDGLLDLAVGNTYTNRYVPEYIDILRGDGQGGFLLHHRNGGIQLNGICAGDLDGDGDVDLVVADYRFGSVNRYLLNDGSGNFGELLPLSTRSSGRCGEVVLGDLDGDGDLDCIGGYRGENVPGYNWNMLFWNYTRHASLPYHAAPGWTLPVEFHARAAGVATGLQVLPFFSGRTGSLALPPFGVLFLDPTQLLILSPATTDLMGQYSLIVSVPRQPALVGSSFYFQALVQGLNSSGPTWGFTNLVGDKVILR